MQKMYEILRDMIGRNFSPNPVYGIEIEVEDARGAEAVAGWDIVGDGSLRNNGVEYVFRAPLNYRSSMEALKLYADMANSRDGFEHNYRTSVHIHANIGHLTQRQVLGLFCVYCVLEPMFFDPERRESPYCIGIGESSNAMEQIMQAFSTDPHPDFYSRIGGRQMKYMALGTCRLLDLGTFEFRMFSGSNDYATLASKLDYIDHLLRAAAVSFDKEDVTRETIRNCALQLIAAYGWGKDARRTMLRLLDDVVLTLSSVSRYAMNPYIANLRMAVPAALRPRRPGARLRGRNEAPTLDADMIRLLDEAGLPQPVQGMWEVSEPSPE
jgi:hypothetical protein